MARHGILNCDPNAFWCPGQHWRLRECHFRKDGNYIRGVPRMLLRKRGTKRSDSSDQVPGTHSGVCPEVFRPPLCSEH
jgi:hypothetical protein